MNLANNDVQCVDVALLLSLSARIFSPDIFAAPTNHASRSGVRGCSFVRAEQDAFGAVRESPYASNRAFGEGASSVDLFKLLAVEDRTLFGYLDV